MLRRTARGIRVLAGAALGAVLSLGGLAAVDAANSPAAQAIGQDTFHQSPGTRHGRSDD